MDISKLRPKALIILIADKIVIKTDSGKYYPDKDKLALMKATSCKALGHCAFFNILILWHLAVNHFNSAQCKRG